MKMDMDNAFGEEATCSWETNDMFSGLNNLDDGNDEPQRGGDSSDGDNEELGSEDHVLVYPRRKLGQEKMGSERPPVVVTRKYLESNYDIPLTVVAKKLNISATVLKQLCRRVGIAKWPYKRGKVTSYSHKSKKDYDMRLISSSSSSSAQKQEATTQQSYSSCFGQSASPAPGVPVVAFSPVAAVAPEQEQPKVVEPALPAALPRFTITHTADSVAPAFTSSSFFPTPHDHSAPVVNETTSAELPVTGQLELASSRSPSPLDAHLELATGTVCEIPEPADDFNPDALRLAAALWRKAAHVQPEMD